MNESPFLLKAKFQHLFSYNIYQQLSESSKLGLPGIAKRSLGLHAARVKSPIMAIAARSGVCDMPNQLQRSPKSILLKQPSIRGTLYMYGPLDAEIFHAATVGARVARKLQSLKRQGATEHHIALAELAILEACENWVRNKDLYDNVHEALRDYISAFQKEGVRKAINGFIRLLWDQGKIYIEDRSTSWASEDRWFRVRQKIDQHYDPLVARRIVIENYVANYGPVAIQDIVCWTGLAVADVMSSLREIEGLVSIRIEDCSSTLIWNYREFQLFQNEMELLLERQLQTKPIYFLAYEDPLIKAYWYSRERFSASIPLADVFYRTGEAKASVISEGRLVGTWVWDKRGHAKLSLATSVVGAEKKRIYAAFEDHLHRLFKLV